VREETPALLGPSETANLTHWAIHITVKVKVTLRLAVCRQSVRLGAKPFETHCHHFFQFNACGHSPYVISFLMRGWVCRLQLLLAFASAVILRAESRKTHNHILLSRIRYSPNLEGQVLVFISPRNRVGQLYPVALGSLSFASYGWRGCCGGVRSRLYTVRAYIYSYVNT
jgi:hypothetical protein